MWQPQLINFTNKEITRSQWWDLNVARWNYPFFRLPLSKITIQTLAFHLDFYHFYSVSYLIKMPESLSITCLIFFKIMFLKALQEDENKDVTISKAKFSKWWFRRATQDLCFQNYCDEPPATRLQKCTTKSMLGLILPYYNDDQCPWENYLVWYLCGWSSLCVHIQSCWSSEDEKDHS